MMTYVRGKQVAVVLGVFALLACGEAESEASVGDAAPAAVGAVPAAAPADGGATSTDRFEVRIADGPFAGTHQSSGDFDCFAQQGMWGAGYTIDLDRPSGLTEFSVMLNGVPESGGRTEDVNLGLTFGSANDEGVDAGTAGIGGAVGGGSGVATVERSGSGAVIRIEGTNFSGGNLSAVVECSEVEVIT